MTRIKGINVEITRTASLEIELDPVTGRESHDALIRIHGLDGSIPSPAHEGPAEAYRSSVGGNTASLHDQQREKNPKTDLGETLKTHSTPSLGNEALMDRFVIQDHTPRLFRERMGGWS